MSLTQPVVTPQLIATAIVLCALTLLSGCGGDCLAIGGCSDSQATTVAAPNNSGANSAGAGGIAVVGPLFSATGTGDTVFKLPASVSVLDITGRFEGGSSNFVVYIGGDLKVNEIIGTRWPSTSYSGRVTATPGGLVEITNSNGVSWSITEVRL